MFDIIFQLLLFVIKLSRSFSRLIIAVCHAISYFMNFIELWLVAIQLFNIDSISIDCLYLSPQKHRCILTEVFAQPSSRLSCTRFENGVEGNSGCKRFRRKKENYQRALTSLNEAMDILRSPCMSSCHSVKTATVGSLRTYRK